MGAAGERVRRWTGAAGGGSLTRYRAAADEGCRLASESGGRYDGGMRARSGLPLALLAFLISGLAGACVSTPIQTTPRSETADPAGLDLIGIVTTEGDTVRFDRPRAGDAPSRRLEEPRVEDGEVRATLAGRPYRQPVERVAVWLHREPEDSKRSLLVASALAAVLVGTTLVFVLGGGFD